MLCGLVATVNEGQFRTNLLSAGHAIHNRSFADRSRLFRLGSKAPSLPVRQKHLG